jgi:hypothetical protein
MDLDRRCVVDDDSLPLVADIEHPIVAVGGRPNARRVDPDLAVERRRD